MPRVPGNPWTEENQGKLIKFSDLRICVGDPSLGVSGSNSSSPYQSAVFTQRFATREYNDFKPDYKAQRDIGINGGRTDATASQGFWYHKDRCVSWRQATVYIGGRYANLQAFGFTSIQAAMIGSPHLASRFPSSTPYDYFLVVFTWKSLFVDGLEGPKIYIFGVRKASAITRITTTLLSAESFSFTRSINPTTMSGFTETTRQLCYYVPENTDGTGDQYFYIVQWDELFTTVTSQEIHYGRIGSSIETRVTNGDTSDSELSIVITQELASVVYIKAEQDSFFFLGSFIDEGITENTSVFNGDIVEAQSLLTRHSVFSVTPSGISKVFDINLRSEVTRSVNQDRTYFPSLGVFEGSATGEYFSRDIKVFYFSGITREVVFKSISFTNPSSATYVPESGDTIVTQSFSQTKVIEVFYQVGTSSNLLASDTSSNSYTFVTVNTLFTDTFSPSYTFEQEQGPLAFPIYFGQAAAYTNRLILCSMYDTEVTPFSTSGEPLAADFTQFLTVLIDRASQNTSTLPQAVHLLDINATSAADLFTGVGVGNSSY